MRDCVLITGGSGSFGKTMLNGLLETDVDQVRIFSRDEEKQDAMRQSIRDDRIRYYIGDVRDADAVSKAVRGATRIFHAAALKQVPSCEFFPLEAIRTNVLGSENVIRAAIAHEVPSLVCLSTDKAVMPVNAMGMSKALMEKAAKAAAREIGPGHPTKISCVRYGNVMYSRGSVIPLFIQQILRDEPVTVTEPTMTRFLMPLRDSVALVLYAFQNARQGDLFIKKAVASTIGTLAQAVCEVVGRPDHPVQVIGWRHGEKLYEALASSQELASAEDMGDYYRMPLDTRSLNYSKYVDRGSHRFIELEDFTSHNVPQLGLDELVDLLRTLPEIQAVRAEIGLEP